MTIFNDQYLSDKDRKMIHDFALAARNLLMNEASDLLEGVYGLRPDGSLADLQKLPNLEKDWKGRRPITSLINFWKMRSKPGWNAGSHRKTGQRSGLYPLEPLAAFKMMETRKLIRQAVGKGNQSNGFIFYLVDHPDDEACGNWVEKASKPLTGISCSGRRLR